ncbi:hypothetical protein Vadar_025479 [Vaccinium darrowii]|uniref:Uncharacterized protein n=1 Tax=Vaccinium darrowii TaxID=229202 RepID=A0ACB7Z5Z2_9ERIC|nr:hypothetical protein Vadar_025479 [Vaccinium darrowii]
MMKSLRVIFLCLIATALFCVSECVGSSSLMRGRRLVREPMVSVSNQHSEYHKIQVRKMRIKPGGSTVTKFSTSKEGLEELFYHIDYHGVMTHPAPMPKHPTP